MSRALAHVGVIGLGVMGGIMSGALVKQGHVVSGHDPIAALRRKARAAGALTPGSNAALAQEADLLIVSLPGVAALDAVIEELRGAPVRARPQIVLETSTLPLAVKLRAARALRAQGRIMLDAPISGTATRSPASTWIMYLSGPVVACRKGAEVAKAFTLQAPRVGELGAGTKLKLAANHLVAIYNVACAEMLTLCRAMGLDPEIALQQMGASPYIGTGLMRLRMPMMIRDEYQPATMKLRLWQKDMQIIGEMARARKCPTPLLDVCAGLYTAASDQGLGEHDTASVAQVLARLAKPAG